MAEFLKNFDCKNEAHVMWLKDIGQAMKKAASGDSVNIHEIVNNNPLDGSPKMENVIDWPYTHFQLCYKYTNAVLNLEAFVPSK